MSQFGADLEKFHERNAEVVGISIDTPWTLNRFAKEVGYNGLMVSDFNKEIATAYDVLNPDVGGLKGVARRSCFVIDRTGTIRWNWLTSPEQPLPNNEEILEVLRKL